MHFQNLFGSTQPKALVLMRSLTAYKNKRQYLDIPGVLFQIEALLSPRITLTTIAKRKE